MSWKNYFGSGCGPNDELPDMTDLYPEGMRDVSGNDEDDKDYIPRQYFYVTNAVIAWKFIKKHGNFRRIAFCQIGKKFMIYTGQYKDHATTKEIINEARFQWDNMHDQVFGECLGVRGKCKCLDGVI